LISQRMKNGHEHRAAQAGHDMDANQIIEDMQGCVLAVSKRGIVTYANRSARERLTLAAGDDLLGRLAYERDLTDFIERCATSTTVLQHRLRVSRDQASPLWECRGERLRCSDDAHVEQVLLRLERTHAPVESSSIAPGAVLTEASAHVDVEFRVRELQHRFKNSIQMIMGALDATRRRVEDESARRALQSAMQQVQAIADVQRMVTQVLAARTIAAQEFLETLCGAVHRSLVPPCGIKCEASAPTIPVAMSTHLALIINELVTNAVKYGASDSALPIDVQLHEADGALVLCVSDSGPGFDLGTSGKGSGLGLVQQLVRQLGGTFSVASRGGACCIVEIPRSTRDEREAEDADATVT
jgi:two-component sensor histidine kinase